LRFWCKTREGASFSLAQAFYAWAREKAAASAALAFSASPAAVSRILGDVDKGRMLTAA